MSFIQNVKDFYYDIRYTQQKNRKNRKWDTGSEYVQKVAEAKTFRDNITKYKAVLGIDTAGDYGALFTGEAKAVSKTLSNDINNIIQDIKNYANPASSMFINNGERLTNNINNLAKRRDTFITAAYKENIAERYKAKRNFKEKTDNLYNDGTGGTFEEDFGSLKNRRQLINDFNNISKDLKDKELEKEYESIIKKHYKGKEMAENTNFKEWGEKIKTLADNEKVKQSMNTMSESEKNINTLSSARRKIHERKMYNKEMDKKYGDDAEKHYRKGTNYEPLSWNEAEVNSHRGKINEARILKGEKFNFGKGKVAMAVMGLAGLAGVTSLMFSGGRQQNSNLYNANQAMY